MMKFLALAFLAVSVLGDDIPLNPLTQFPRIVGGEVAAIADVPWQVAMLYDGSGAGAYSLRCGGSIMSSTVIVTAAHCVSGTRQDRWRIRAGSQMSNSGGQVVDVKSFKFNEGYNSNIDYDIAVMLLSSPLSLDGTTTRAVPLPAQGEAVADGAAALTSGWGSTSSGGSVTTTLRKVTIPIVNQDVCASAYSGFNPITARMICAGLLNEGGKDACQGDSGGPLVVAGKLVGVTSWGRGCAQKGYPGVWSRVASMRTWVDSNIN